MSYFLTILIALSLFMVSCTKKEPTATVKTATSKMACFKVEGMTCETCSTSLKVSVNKLEGINSVNASSDANNAVVSYEPSKVDIEAIKGKIDLVGYKATIDTCSESAG